MKNVNVLITAASRRVPLVRAFRRAVERTGRGRVITTDINPLSPALYFSNRHHIVPLTTDRNYIPIIRSICDVEGVHLIIPTIDDELPIFGHSLEDFADDGVEVAVSPEATSVICNDKYQTYQFCRKNGFATPRTVLPRDIDFGGLRYPVVVKPRFGRGSVNVFVVQNEPQLRLFLEYVQDPIVQEFVEGIEFTVDLLADFDGNLLSIVPRERLVIRAGVSDKGVTRKNPAVIEFSRLLAGALNVRGPANLQCKWDGREVSLIEVNPRFSGGIPLTIASGADFPRWLVDLRAGRRLPADTFSFQEDLTMMSYEESIFATEQELTARPRRRQSILSRQQMSGLVN